MEKHWDNYCTMSIVHFMAYPQCMSGEGAIAESVAGIGKDTFFGGVEVTRVKDPMERSALKRAVETTQIQVGFGAQPVVLMGGLNPSSVEESQRRLAVRELMACVDEASELGAHRLAFLSGKDPGDKDRTTAVRGLVKSTKELCAYGREKGVNITLETFDREVEKKALIGPSVLAAEFAGEVRADYSEFGLMYDLSHQPLLGEKSEEALNLLKDYLVHIHVGNCVVTPGVPGYGDLHPPFGWPGSVNGVPQLVEFIRALFKVGYLADGKKDRPWVGFEVKPQRPNEEPEQVIAGAKRTWREAWSRA